MMIFTSSMPWPTAIFGKSIVSILILVSQDSEDSLGQPRGNRRLKAGKEWARSYVFFGFTLVKFQRGVEKSVQVRMGGRRGG